MLRKFLKAVSRDWGSLVTGSASIPLTVFAFWANTPLQRTAWAIFASACLVSASYRIWAFEYRRAEAAEAQLKVPLRPWVIIDNYSFAYLVDEETGEEFLSETVHIVNRGQVAAVSINPDIHLADGTARIVGSLPTLGPGESIDVRMRDLCEVLKRTRARMRDGLQQPIEGSRLKRPLPLRLPLVIEYRSLDHKRWTTEHTISFTGYEIYFTMAHPDDPQLSTDLTSS